MYCWKCSTENPYAKFCFDCAYPMAADLDAISFDRIVAPFDGAAFSEFLTCFRDDEFIVRKDETENDSNKELKISLAFISVEFAVILTVNNLYNFINLINLYKG